MARTALFFNPAFVDLASDFGESFAEAEGINVRESLLSLGHHVRTYGATDAAGVAAALDGAHLAVFPYMEISAYVPSQEVEDLYAGFVAAGGTLVVHGNGRSIDLLNSIFEFSMQRVSGFSTSPSTKTSVGLADPHFDGAPTTLVSHSMIHPIIGQTLPAGSKIHYSIGGGTHAGSAATIVEIPYGEGSIVYLAWDWFNAAPEGSKDSGWLAAYKGAIDTALPASALDSNLSTSSGETEIGTEGDDAISGLGGDDVLYGRGGNDRLDGNEGNDALMGEEGDDQLLISGLGNDSADGGAGHDTLILDFADDTGGVARTRNLGGYSPLGGHEGAYESAGRVTAYSEIERFVITTGSGDDVLETGDGDDVIATGAGNDRVTALAGDDWIDGGTGQDWLDGGAGLDTLLGGNDGDMLKGGAGADLLDGGAGNDTMEGGDGDDQLLHSAEASVSGWDFANGGAGVDTLVADFGNSGPVTMAAPSPDGFGGYNGSITSGSGHQLNFVGIEAFVLNGGIAADTLIGGGGADMLAGLQGDDRLEGRGGDDELDGGTGADTMRGGAGNDRYAVDDVGDVVEENAGEGTDTVTTWLASYSLAALLNIENITGNAASGQVLTGNAADNRIAASYGSDVLHLWVGGGNDNVLAGDGMDNIFFGATLTSADIVNGGAGVDTLVVQGPYGSLTLTANITQIENVSILGGNNTNFGEPGTNRYDYVLTIDDANFAAGVQARINGAALLEGEDFTFDGSAETDAKFVVYGGKGKDTLLGGPGNDIFFYAEERFATGDTVNGGAGYDGMFLRGNYTIDFNAPGYTGLFTNIENLTLTSATDERYARGGGTEFDYNLTLSDAIVGAGQLLTVSGSLLMATETMVLDASQETNGSLNLFGGKAADTLKGGAMADLLHGNLGADTLAGNGGADLFRYQDVAESTAASRDWILDFTPGTDRIELTRIDADSLLAGDQAFTWIGSNAFSGSAGQLRAYQSSGTWYVEGDTDGDGVADLVIALTLQGPSPLTQADFHL